MLCHVKKDAILTMNIRIAVITLFFALFFGVTAVHAQGASVNGVIRLEPYPETGDGGFSYKYEEYVVVYSFATMDDAKNAVKSLKDSPNDTPDFVRDYVSPETFVDEASFKISVPDGGVIVVWTTDPTFAYEKNLNKNGEYKHIYPLNRINGDLNVTFEGEKSLEEVVIESTLTYGEAEPVVSGGDEGIEGMVRSISYRFPYRVCDNMRILVQPILYDRSDISDVESDTIYSFGRAVYVDMSEYGSTQLRRMDFDLENDSINYYIRQQGDCEYYNEMEKDSLRRKPYVRVNATQDTINIYLEDRFQGFDPDTSHPYPYGFHVSINDYNSEIYTEDVHNDGERRNPLRFLDYSFTEFMPDKKMFEIPLRNENIQTPGELRLNFAVGATVISPNDSASNASLKALRDTLYNVLEHSKIDPDTKLNYVNIYGVASPDGKLATNKSLAQRRAAYAVSKVKDAAGGRPVEIGETKVAGWDVLADSLMKDGYEEEANAIYEIVKRYPVKNDNDAASFANQEREIKKLPSYNDFIKKDYLPKLRAVKYSYAVTKVGKQPVDTIVSRYRRNPTKAYPLGVYWILIDNLKDAEREEVATRSLYPFGDDYRWPFAASVLAASYIKRDTIDLELLKPHLDLTIYKSSQGRDSLVYRRFKKDYETELYTEYINYPDVAANQLIMILRSKDKEYNKDIPALEGIIAEAAKTNLEYKKLRAFSRCLRGKYKGESEDDKETRDLVMDSSPLNYAVLALAMDNPNSIADDEEWLKKASEGISKLPHGVKRNYLTAILKVRQAYNAYVNRNTPLRKKLLEEATIFVAKCCSDDLTYFQYACNDADLLLQDGSEDKVFSKATEMWHRGMKENASLGDEHPYPWFDRAMTEAMKDNPDKDVLRTNLYKCFSLDNRYITVFNIYLRDSKELSEKKDVLALLRSIRNDYMEKK